MRRFLLSLCLVLLVHASAVFAEDCGGSKLCGEPGDLGVFGDTAGTMTRMDVQGFVPFHLYLIAFDPPGGVRGFDFGLTIPETFTVLTEVMLGGVLNIAPPDSDDYIVALGACYSPGPSIPLVTVNLGYFAGPVVPIDTAICLRPADPASIPGSIAYQNCSGDPVEFGIAIPGLGRYPDGCIILNPTDIYGPCPIEDSSFGAVKARFASE